MQMIQKTRAIDPFFEKAINQVFLQPEKTFYVMDGAIGLGKSSNFLMWGAYQIAQCVEPIEKNDRLVRESLWAGIRESENSAEATFMQLLEGAIFSPEIMALDNSPVQLYGTHPRYIKIAHDLPDGTFLEMKIECHGFNNIQALNRLKSREYLGALVPEVQGIPWGIFTTAGERCGRWRTEQMKISKEIDGKKYSLTGLNKLKIVLADVNIPERPHLMYSEYYDRPNKKDLPFAFLTPPPPLKYIETFKVSDEALLEQYPVTIFEGKEVMWYPNPDCYNMTKHFEEKDETTGKNIPWSGFSLWYKELFRSDSEVRRYVLGLPDTVGGAAAIYKNFAKDDKTMVKKKLEPNRIIYVGYDPGGSAAVQVLQHRSDNTVHVFKEWIFTPVDRTSCRNHFADFFFPYARKHLKGYEIHIILDPASTHLGKNMMTGQEESVGNMIKDEMLNEKQNFPDSPIIYKIKPCMVSNQDTGSRINSLGFFIDKKRITIDPECEGIEAALAGGYQRIKLSSGVISDNIDKNNPHSHPAEALQYPVVNILTIIKKARNAKNKSSKRGAYTVRRSR